MKKIINDFLGAFGTDKKQGYSGLKLTAFALILYAGYLHTIIDYSKPYVVLWTIIADITGAFLCLGIFDAEDLLSFKHGRPKEDAGEADKGTDN